MTLALLLLCIGVGPEPVYLHDHVTEIEINHLHDEQARHVFTQLIFRDLQRDGSMQICDWRLVKVCEQLPIGKRVVYHDGMYLRKITTRAVMERWTQYDPELLDRSDHPQQHRRELTPPVTKSRARQLIKEWEGR